MVALTLLAVLGPRPNPELKCFVPVLLFLPGKGEGAAAVRAFSLFVEVGKVRLAVAPFLLIGFGILKTAGTMI